MATSRVSHYRSLLVLAIFLALWWLAPVAVRSFSRTSFSLFQAPGWVTYSRLKDLQDYWTLRNHSQTELIEAGRDAIRQANAATLQTQEDEQLRNESERLRELLQLPEEPGFRYVFARVIRRDETAWWQQILIHKGRNDGVEPGQGVVFAGGVVGRIALDPARLLPTMAWVELSTSPSFRVAASLGRDPNPVIYQGVETAPFHVPSGEVHNISLSYSLPDTSPLPLLTSRYAEKFPAGIVLGMVDNLVMGDDGVSKAGLVKLDPRLTNLYEVAVLVPDTSGSATLPSLPAAAAPGAIKPAATTIHRTGGR